MPAAALAGTTGNRPALPLVRDEEAVPAACPIGRSRTGSRGHSRGQRHGDELHHSRSSWVQS